MTRKILAVFVVVGSMTVVHAESLSLEQELYIENQDKQLEDNYIQSRMLANKAKREGIATIKSLRANLAFIQKLESDPEFRKCVVLNNNLKKLDSLAIGAKKLLDNGKATQKDYQEYMSELKSEKESLEKKINSKQCNEEG